MKQDVRLVAYIFRSAFGQISLAQFSDDFLIEEVSPGKWTLANNEHSVSKMLYTERISSIAALVGKNSSGKTTVLEDICRILCAKTPMTTEYCLLMEHSDGIYKLSNSGDISVTFEGVEIGPGSARENANLKVVYFSGTFDPFGRVGSLASSGGAFTFVDISTQNVLSEMGYRRNFKNEDDITAKIAYLSHVSQRNIHTLELDPEGIASRSIFFIASLGYQAASEAKDFLELLLVALPRESSLFDRLVSLLKSHRAITEQDIDRLTENGFSSAKLQGILKPIDSDYFELLHGLFLQNSKQPGHGEDPFIFCLAIGRLNDMIRKRHGAENQARFQSETAQVFVDFDGAADGLMGDEFLHHAECLADYVKVERSSPHARAEDIDEHVWNFSLSVEISSHSANDSKTTSVLFALAKLRALDFYFTVRFSGISEGQKSLLTFFSRFYTQEIKEAHSGNTILLIDEHEQGLHPEWQRRYIAELSKFINRESHPEGRVQVLLSSHSPFVVADLPASCVSLVGQEEKKTKRTFAANLLELILSPLFMQKTTGEFAEGRLKKFLQDIEKASDIESLKKMRPFVDMIADELIRNFVIQHMQEKAYSLGERND